MTLPTMPTAHTNDDPSHVQHRVPTSARASSKQKQVAADAPNGEHAEPSKSPTADRENRPPAKRARKAINCEPCRNSKLKCDRSVSSFPSTVHTRRLTQCRTCRGRPCSSCVLRGNPLSCFLLSNRVSS